MHHIIISLPILGLPNQLGIMQPSRMLTLGQAPWCRVIAMDRRWSKHNSEYTMTSARRSEGLPNFHPFVTFLCICQKTKILLRQTFAEPILWELITLGDVGNPSSDHWTLTKLWLEIVCEIMSLLGLCLGLGVTDTMLVTYLVISGSSGMLWLCPRHRHCLCCLHCQLSVASAPVPQFSLSLLPSRCLLFITFFWPYFVAGVSFFCVRASDLFSCWHRPLCASSLNSEVIPGCVCVSLF